MSTIAPKRRAVTNHDVCGLVASDVWLAKKGTSAIVQYVPERYVFVMFEKVAISQNFKIDLFMGDNDPQGIQAILQSNYDNPLQGEISLARYIRANWNLLKMTTQVYYTPPGHFLMQLFDLIEW